ncbi:p21-activated protein kinase-interacting protein 1-like protein [Tritrichomonas foetus]|uniref:P21-activated protein kinase-interacting protein 1-like protein n=1 Tax=Tritrichomonas foetus TaxID=1144522 RepID=A0A1J4KUA3_9EUKA|nr:p21-activated protein kinase-interacting protein 1-like protein [Tritrichomonas foetus]|eukprot:OHT14857.1 p21-activated protein kinase-interacting protein 1-like protein [Tritrichomonas foetus]
MCEEIGTLAIGTYDGILFCYRIWKIPEGCTDLPEGVPKDYVGYFTKLIFNFQPHDGAIRQLASSSRYIASGGYDGAISLFDLKVMKNIGSLVQHDDCIESLAFFKNFYLISGSADKTICLWRISDWGHMKQLKGHTAALTSMAISPTGKFMLSTGKDGALRMWDLMHGHNARTRKIGTSATFVGFSEDSKQFFFGYDNMVRYCDGVTETVLFDFPHEKQVTCYSVNGATLWVGTTNGLIYAWSTETGDSLGVFKFSESDRIKMLSANNQYLICLTSSGIAKIGVVSEDFEIDTVMEWDIKTRITCGTFIPSNRK